MIEIQDGVRLVSPNPSNFKSSDRYNSAAYYSISVKFGIEIDHATAATLQTFKVKGSKVKVTAYYRQRSTVVRPVQNSIRKWKIRPLVKL